MKTYGVVFFIFLTFIRADAFHDDINVPTTEQLISWHGYSVENHEVITEDNYVLGVVRIKGAPNCMSHGGKTVILAHGILCSSTDWIATGPKNALAYLLADHGYNVWLMNFRGNRYSRKHLSLNHEDEAFWNFSWHEMGVYDIPAVVDHVLKTEGPSQGVTFVCHSMGCTSLLVTLSERPEYNQKIDSAHMMAPITIMNHTRSIINSIKGVINKLEEGQAVFGRKEVSGQLIESMWGELCLREKIYPLICSCPVFLLTGWHSLAREYPPSFWEVIHHQQGGLSSKTLIHFIQVANAGIFQKFNYSGNGKISLYGRDSAPAYDMKLVSVPINIYYSETDSTVDIRDLYRLASSFPSGIEMRPVSKKINHHLDFVWRAVSRKSVYNKITEEMKTRENGTDYKCHRFPDDDLQSEEKTTYLPSPWDRVATENLTKFQKIHFECRAVKGNPTEEMREVINDLGYPMEYHVMTTEDGYVLAAHRIPPMSTNGHSKKPYPVLLVHGTLMTSFSWLVLGPKKSLGYKLADAGFDVWMINLRGNSNSKTHVTLQQCSDKFWDFSWHEMGIYDLPAAIDYILATTNMSKVDIIGYSLGSNIIAVMGATRPEYNKKVNVMHLLAPSAILTKVEQGMKIMAYVGYSDTLRGWVFGDSREITAPEVTRLVSDLCKLPIMYKLCTAFAFTVYGFHEEKHDEDQLALYLRHVPDGTSTKTLVHLAQIALSGRFEQFDMEERNFEVYGQDQPPIYNLTALTASARIYFSEIDEGVHVAGLRKFAEQLPSLIGMHERKHYRHQDYLFPLEEQVAQYEEIIRNIKSDRE